MRLKYEQIFESFFQGGFECSTHRLQSRGRLDEVAATQHDRFAVHDYRRLHEQAIRVAREGLRWHLIEAEAGNFDVTSILPFVIAAQETKTQVVWDLFHYGWPDWLDIFSPQFVDAFANLARRFVQFVKNEIDQTPYIAPVNEISFFSWAAGDKGIFYPFAIDRGDELKQQLVRAAIAAIEAIWEVEPKARIAQIDPVINVLPTNAENAADRNAAESYRLSQYQAWDMLAGRLQPELGGDEKYLDLIGVNYYVHNQWVLGEGFILPDDPRYRPFSEIVKEVHERYGRPMFVAETGIEDEKRPDWLRYVCEQVRLAMKAGVQMEGICLYPIVNHPGWADDRHCYNGLWDYPDDEGNREIYQPLAEEIAEQQKQFENLLTNVSA